MKLVFIFILLLTNFNISAATITHESDTGKKVTISSDWDESIMGYVFYGAEFNLQNINNNDFMIVNTFPKGLLINESNIPQDSKELEKLLKLIDRVEASDNYYAENEVFTINHTTKIENLTGVFATSHFENSSSKNYIWMGVVNDHSIVVKIVSKDSELNYSHSEIESIIANLNISENTSEQNSTLKKSSIYHYNFFQYSDLIKEMPTPIDGPYKRMNLSFSEEDRLSLYGVSSICMGATIPYELFLEVVLDNFGYENSSYSHEVKYKGKNYYFNLGGYDNDKGNFNSVSFVTMDSSCQHALTYITESSEPILERFYQFVDHIDPLNVDKIIDFSKVDEIERKKYAQLLYEIAEKYYSLKVYKKSIDYYQAAYDIYANKTYFYDLIQSHYNISQYHEGLNLILKHEDEINEQNLIIWKAWYLARMNRPKESAETFAIALSSNFTEDDDLFKYLGQLYLAKDYQSMLNVANRFKSEVEDSNKLQLMMAKSLVNLDPEKAKDSIEKLLNIDAMANTYQFELLDYLADIEAYDLIEKISLKRIEQGYESGVLLNYLGDAQNQLGKIDLAYLNMKKAHEMLPENTVIEGYYQSLQKKVGKSDVSIIEDTIAAVELPEKIKEHINQLVASHVNDSYEYLYAIDAYSHVIGESNKHTHYGKIRINNQTGIEKNKTLYFAFNQQYEEAYLNYLRVFDANGNLIQELDKSTTFISTDSDGQTGDDDMLINIPVPSLSVGVEVEYAFSKENKSVNDTQGLIEKVFVSSVTNQYKAIVLTGDIDNVLVKKSPDVQQHNIADDLVYWDFNNLPNYKKTPYLPDFENIFPWIKMASSKDNWQDIGSHYLKDIDTKINTEFTQQELLTYVNESSDIEEIAKNITIHTQKSISYQAIEFGDRALIPNTSRQTLSNKYGDCKDHAVLLYDLLNAAGIKAQLALINADKDIVPELPNMAQFNHMIVYLPEINGGVFIDITDKDSAIDFNSTPIHLQGHTALVLESDQSKLIQVPKTSPENNPIKVTRVVEENNSQIIYHEKSIIEGHYAASLRNYLKSMEVDEIEYRLTHWVGNYYSGLEIKNFKFNNLYDNQIPLKLEFTFAQDKQFITTKLPVFMEQYVMEFVQSPNRQWDFEYKIPFVISAETSIKPGSKLKFKKSQFSNDSELMNWNIKSDKNTISFNSSVYANKLPASEYSELVKQSTRSYRIIENLLVD